MLIYLIGILLALVVALATRYYLFSGMTALDIDDFIACGLIALVWPLSLSVLVMLGCIAILDVVANVMKGEV